jgi:CrcB protein
VTADGVRIRPLVFAGGFVGTLIRWSADVSIGFLEGLPAATLIVNMIGSIGLGLVVGLRRRGALGALAPLLGAGLMGGLTTFGTVMVQLLSLVRDGRTTLAVTYLAISVIGGLTLAALGVRIGAGRA